MRIRQGMYAQSQPSESTTLRMATELAREKPPSAATRQPRHFLTLGAVLLVAGLFRIPFLGAFPDVQNDEGLWTNSTKNFLMFGDWFMDERAHLFLSPVFHFLSLPAFWLLGPGIESARVVSAVAGVASVGLIYLLALRLTGDRRLATLGALLLAVDPWAVAHSRQALTESVLLFFILLSGVLIAGNRRHLWLAGAAFSLAILTKLSAGAMGIALGGYLLLRSSDASGQPLRWPQRVADGAVFGVVALGLTGLGYWLVSFIDPERFIAVFQRELGGEHLLGDDSTGSPRRLGLDPVLAGRNALEVLRFNPFLIVLGAVGGAVAWALRTPGWLLLLLWAGVGLGFPLTQVYQPLRYFFPAVPALVLLVSGLVLALPKISSPKEARRLLVAVICLIVGFNGAYIGMNVLANWGNRARIVEHWAVENTVSGANFLAATHFATNLPGRAYSHDVIASTPEDLLATIEERGIDYVVWSSDEWSEELRAVLGSHYSLIQEWSFGGVFRTSR